MARPTILMILSMQIDADRGWILLEALGINALGQIVGTALFQGEEHGFLLTPVRAKDGVLALSSALSREP
jgi:probable HAF family extracellular repeat protein